MAPDLHTGRYAAFIWPAYAITLLVLIGLVLETVLRARRWKALAERGDREKERKP